MNPARPGRPRRAGATALTAVLDGRYTGRGARCYSALAVCQKPMPDESAIRFWTSVARAFKGNNAVIFDLFNEPYGGVGPARAGQA